MSTFDPDDEERLIEEFDWALFHEYSDRQEAREQDQYLNWYECNKEFSVEERTFRIETTWTMTATVPVQAKNLEEAMEKVLCMEGLPDNGRYLDDSFQIDEGLTKDLYYAGQRERALGV